MYHMDNPEQERKLETVIYQKINDTMANIPDPKELKQIQDDDVLNVIFETIQEKYRGVLKDQYSKQQFIREARMEMPNFITATNSFNDVVSILKNKGVLAEEKQEQYNQPAPGYSLEALERAIDVELETMGVETATQTPSKEDYDKAKEKAVKNLEKNPNHYLHLMSGDSDKVDKHDKFKEYKDKDKVERIRTFFKVF